MYFNYIGFFFCLSCIISYTLQYLILASKLQAQMLKIIEKLPYIAPIHSTLDSYFSIPFLFLLPISQGSKTARLSWPVSCECSTSTATQTGRCPSKNPVLTSQTPFRVQPSHVCSKAHFLTMTRLGLK